MEKGEPQEAGGPTVLPSPCDTHPLGNCLDLTHIVVTFCLGHLNYKMPPAEKASGVRAAFPTSPCPTSHTCIASTALPTLPSVFTLLTWLLSLYLGTCCFQYVWFPSSVSLYLTQKESPFPCVVFLPSFPSCPSSVH